MPWCDPFVRNRSYETGGWAAKNGSLFFDNCRLILVRWYPDLGLCGQGSDSNHPAQIPAQSSHLRSRTYQSTERSNPVIALGSNPVSNQPHASTGRMPREAKAWGNAPDILSNVWTSGEHQAAEWVHHRYFLRRQSSSVFRNSPSSRIRHRWRILEVCQECDTM